MMTGLFADLREHPRQAAVVPPPHLPSLCVQILESILDKRLSSNLATLFGPHLTCHLSLAQSHLFVALADTIQVLPAMEDVM